MTTQYVNVPYGSQLEFITTQYANVSSSSQCDTAEEKKEVHTTADKTGSRSYPCPVCKHIFSKHGLRSHYRQRHPGRLELDGVQPIENEGDAGPKRKSDLPSPEPAKKRLLYQANSNSSSEGPSKQFAVFASSATSITPEPMSRRTQDDLDAALQILAMKNSLG